MTPRIFLECFVITKVNNPVFFSEARCGNYKSISFPKVSMSRTIVMPNLDLFLWDFFFFHAEDTWVELKYFEILNASSTITLLDLLPFCNIFGHTELTKTVKNSWKFVYILGPFNLTKNSICTHCRSWFWWFSKDSLFIQKVRLFYCRKKFYLAKRNRNALSNAEPQ